MNLPPSLLSHLKQAQRITVFTGAGVSAESGVPTFRDAQTGLWSQYRAEELATPEAFLNDPGLVWRWYAWRRKLVSAALPNPAHIAIAALEARVPQFTLITQNVDGLHQRAGSKNVIELHGNISRVKCFAAGHPADEWDQDSDHPPHCAVCGSLLRPDVVWFNEQLPQAALNTAEAVARSSQVFFSIGTSMLVYPAANIPLLAIDAGAIVIQINPDSTKLDALATYSLIGRAGEVLPDIVRRIND